MAIDLLNDNLFQVVAVSVNIVWFLFKCFLYQKRTNVLNLYLTLDKEEVMLIEYPKKQPLTFDCQDML